jgi:hypothetical protein
VPHALPWASLLKGYIADRQKTRVSTETRRKLKKSCNSLKGNMIHEMHTEIRTRLLLKHLRAVYGSIDPAHGRLRPGVQDQARQYS